MIEYVLAALASLPVFVEDRGAERAAAKVIQFHHVALAIDDASRAKGWPGSDRELAALMLTVAWHETKLSLRIHAGTCRRWECDRGRARGLWQMHAEATSSTIAWHALTGIDPASTRLAAAEAARALVRSRRMCRSLEAHGISWVEMTLTGYAGRGCRGYLVDLPARVQTFHRLTAVSPKQP